VILLDNANVVHQIKFRYYQFHVKWITLHYSNVLIRLQV